MPEQLSSIAAFPAERREVVRVGDRLCVTIHHPAGAQPRGSVLLIPGWSGPRSGPADILVLLARKLAAAGWTAIRLDLPGRGDSDGNFADVDLDDMIDAAHTVAASRQAAGPVHLLGLCSGGNVALGTVAIRNPQSAIHNAVLALSALPFQPARAKGFEYRRRWKNVKQYAAKAFSPTTWARLLKGDINLERVKKNVTASEKPASGERNLKDSVHDIERELLDWKGPALFVWGGGDEEGPPSRAHFEKLHAAGMGSRQHTVFHTIPGANHNFYARAWREELCGLALRFLDQARP
ncbi:MAG: alpha/beta fold hydrolase [Planctomycetota bacterium]|nr:alpha/beta fold hydrolase [Planctomycetota bacterium]